MPRRPIFADLRYACGVSMKRFEVTDMIGQGGMAEIYRARQVSETSTLDVCIKRILSHLTDDERLVRMFLDEARLAATLDCPNIVRVHDLCRSPDGEYFIVMEFVDGRDLSDIIRTAQLQAKQVPHALTIFVVREILKGLAYAHAKTNPDGTPVNIIHRDISPQNVLVSFQGAVKIGDFGIAKASSMMHHTAVGILKGKYGYMSPEQASGGAIDQRSDLFNTGIVLYELLLGERCFAGGNDFSTLGRMQEARIVPPKVIQPDLPDKLVQILEQALAERPEDRFQNARAFDQAMRAYAEHANAHAGAEEVGQFVRELYHEPDDVPLEPGESSGILSLTSIVQPDADGHSAEMPSAPVVRLAQPTRANRPPDTVYLKKPSANSAARVAAIVGLGVLFGLLAGGLWSAQYDGDKALRSPFDNPARPRAQAARTLWVESVPAGATVHLDSIELSEKTPFAIERPREQNEHVLVVKHAGYAPYNARFRMDASLKHFLITLEPSSASPQNSASNDRARSQEPQGLVDLESDPLAEIVVDGRPLGRLTNSAPISLPAGRPHRVTLLDPRGETTREIMVTVAPGARKFFYINLE
jgi:serine/threonine protein kinase